MILYILDIVLLDRHDHKYIFWSPFQEEMWCLETRTIFSFPNVQIVSNKPTVARYHAGLLWAQAQKFFWEELGKIGIWAVQSCTESNTSYLTDSGLFSSAYSVPASPSTSQPGIQNLPCLLTWSGHLAIMANSHWQTGPSIICIIILFQAS